MTLLSSFTVMRHADRFWLPRRLDVYARAMSNRPGEVRDAIVDVFKSKRGSLTVNELYEAVSKHLGRPVAASSVRSYLNNSGRFERVGRGTYRLVR